MLAAGICMIQHRQNIIYQQSAVYSAKSDPLLHLMPQEDSMDFLDRKSAPINDEEWRSLEDAVTTTSRRMLIGRRIIELLGPLGAGLYAIPYSTFSNGLGAGIA